MIHKIVVLGRAIRFRQICIAAYLRETIDLNCREAAQYRICYPRVYAVAAGGNAAVVYDIEAMMEIPAEPEIIHPGGIRGPGPARGHKLRPESRVVPEIGLRDSRVRYALCESGTVPEEIRSSHRMMIAQVVIDLTEDVINTDNVGKAKRLVD